MSTNWLALSLGLAIAVGLAAVGCDSTPEVNPDLQAALIEQLDAEGLPPAEYVIKAFDHHDIVLLGEYGRVAEDVGFVAHIVPDLAERGVAAIAVPYLCRDDQAEIDSLMVRVTYDENAVVNLQRRHAGGTWPYLDYIAIAKAVWNVNRDRRGAEQPMRLIALSPFVDWEAFHSDDRAAAQMQQRILASTDHVMTAAIQTELEDGDLALVYVGRNDAFTRFSRPVVREGDVVRRDTNRLGQQLKAARGDRVMTVLLHAPFPTESGLVSPCDGALEAVFTARPDSVGFDVTGPFASLKETRSTFAAGSSVTLGSLCDGYIMLKPIPQLNGVSLISAWLPSDDDFDAVKMKLPNRARAEAMDSPRDYRAEFQREAAIGSHFDLME